MSLVVRCESCGGTVVYDAGRRAARCLFCGSEKLNEQETSRENIPVPKTALTARVQQQDADARFRNWASESWWTPNIIRNARVQLQPMFLPAWWARGEVESHWSGTVPANTRSGKAPTSGVAKMVLDGMVPASMGLSAAELDELQPFDHADVHDWAGEATGQPFELPALSEQGARRWLRDRLRQEHLETIISQSTLQTAVSSSIVEEHDHALYMIPIYIGAFRFRNRPWRFLINAQSGEVVGTKPLDRIKVLVVSLIGLSLLTLLAALAGS
jgi:hypothetical protein